MAVHETNATKDSDMHKGAVEDDSPLKQGERPANENSMAGQQGHRDQNESIKDSDSDFPEPGAREEHSGENK